LSEERRNFVDSKVNTSKKNQNCPSCKHLKEQVKDLSALLKYYKDRLNMHLAEKDYQKNKNHE